MITNHPPLAERMRPRTLDEVVGQSHLIGRDGVLRKALAGGMLPSMILWGPPGVGKTTLARLIAQGLKRPFHTLSAISSGIYLLDLRLEGAPVTQAKLVVQ